eukprot:11177368-Lingulodinium_polyedra.AAC.1
MASVVAWSFATVVAVRPASRRSFPCLLVGGTRVKYRLWEALALVGGSRAPFEGGRGARFR